MAAEFPYANLTDEQVIANAKAAFTKGASNVVYNGKPGVCEQDIYDMMIRCWASNPEQRPEFDSLHSFLEDKLGSVGIIVV